MTQRQGSNGGLAAAPFGRALRKVKQAFHNDRRLQWSAVVLGLLAVALMVVPARADHPPVPLMQVPLTLPAASTPATPAAAAPSWHTVTVQPGQTLSQIFDAQGFGYAALNRMLTKPDNAEALYTLHPGDELGFRRAPDGALLAMRFDRDADTRVVLTLNDQDVTEQVEDREVQRRVHLAEGSINSSLFAAGAAAGMDEGTMIQLAEVFKYDIDFIKDIRKGDRFSVVYDDVWSDGERLYPGRIIAAEFHNRGQRFTAFLFTKPDGSFAYYDEDGRPLQRALMRTPVKFSRISSRFARGRKHPVLGYTRAHEGVDYAAPRGTPIHAAGDGRITFRGRARGYGNFIVIKHNKTYSTAYGHMSRFAKGERVGSWVRQGQVIGYVGMTGLATGPHLHYEVRRHGHPVNPLTVTMPKPEPLPASLLARFKASIAPQLAQLQRLDSNRRLLAQRATANVAAPAGSP